MALNLPIKLMEEKEKSSIFLVEMYEIYLPTVTLRYCACDEDIVFNGEKYMAAPIKREAVKATSDSKVDNTKLTVSDFDNSFTLSMLSGYNFLGSRCVIFQIPYPDALTDSSLVYPIFWGDLDAPVLNTKEACFTVDVVAPTTYLENARTMQLPCNAQFADGINCMAYLNDVTGTVQSGSTVYNVKVQQNEPFNFRQHGIITVGFETRRIASSNGSVVTVDYPFRNTPVGTYKMQCGCDLSSDTCTLRGQRANYSGFLNVPFELNYKS